MKYFYKTKGTCARAIELELNDEKIIEGARFEGGCGGNTLGVARLVIGMGADEAIEKLKGIPCGAKATSCPDQLSNALQEALGAMGGKQAEISEEIEPAVKDKDAKGGKKGRKMAEAD